MLEMVIDQRRRDLGGFEVGRLLPAPHRRMVGPFIFFDHMGPADFARGVDRRVDVRPHPHIGLATVTYLLSGEIMHRDSVGSEQGIHPGEVNWMTAGRGITHSERFEKARAEGDHLDGLQAWVALPTEAEETEPAFAHFSSNELATVEAGGTWMQVIAGELYGVRSPVSTFSPLFYAHVRLTAGRPLQLPANYPERAVYVVRGRVAVDERVCQPGEMLVFAPGPAVLEPLSDCTVMLLGGEPVGERFIEWNFVASSRERIEQAKADWRAQRMKLPDLDHDEFIPLPEPAPEPPAAPTA